ncbi:MAG: hypothetical protein IEMM0002_1374 [bacterium]|nr:MAG: hypothetical protein IEMM0002_1374 [bacterium]
MIKLKVFIALLVLTAASSAWAESVMVNHKDAKIRNGPGTDYTILWKPRLYTPMELLAPYGHWYAVRDVEGDVGWIHDSVSLKKPAAIVTSEYVNVRKSPSTKSRILFQAPKNYTFKIIGTKNGWYKIADPDGDKGWVSKKHVWDGGKRAKKKKKK